jgi:uncharacterized protein
MPSLFFIIVPAACAILFFGHFVVYKSFISIFDLSPGATTLWLKISLIVLGLGFIVAMVIAAKYNNTFSRIFYTITASWYGLFLYLFLAVLIYSLFAATFGHLAPTLAILLGKTLIILAVIVSAYGLWNAEQIVFTRYDVALKNLPSAWRGKHAVWISDVHLDQVHNVEYSQRIVDAIKKENPDIVFIGGDLYDGVKINEEAAIAPFKNLKPKDGIYFITGNHEEFGDATHYVNAIKNAEIKVLNNEMINIEGVNIIGVDDRDSTNKNVFDAILSGLKINKNTPTILLKHEPSQLDIAEKSGIDMQISGHTHKGQVYPISYVTDLIYKGYDYGQKQYGAMQVFISSGVGTWGPPLRVGSKSEILVFNFE